MNETKRGFNRAVLIVTGLVLFSVAVTVIGLRYWTSLAEGWHSTAAQFTTGLQQLDQDTALGSAGALSWLTVLVFAVLILLLTVCALLAFGVGGGRTDLMTRTSPGPGVHGSVTVHGDVAATVVDEALSEHAEILSAKVRIREIKKQTMMQIILVPRRGTSPQEATATVEAAVNELGRLLGFSLPTVISIRAGLRSRLSSERSRVQ
ncbi:MAG: hypothetical protein ACTII7_06565 [Galactobacter sp.]